MYIPVIYTLYAGGGGNPDQTSSTDIPENQPQSRPVNKLHITSLTYDSTRERITCTLQNKNKQSALTRKCALQITPCEGTKATIKDASLQHGNYTIDLEKLTLAAGKSCTKTFFVQWNESLMGEFSFQLMGMEDNVLFLGSSILFSEKEEISE